MGEGPRGAHPLGDEGAAARGAEPRPVLHLLSNWKWTGPAEPALNACLAQRAAGVDARFACGRTEIPGSVRERALERGVSPVLADLWLDKHRRPLRGLADARRLRAYLAGEGIALVHAHLANAHRLALRAAAGTPVRVARTLYDDALPAARWERRLLARSDLVGCVSARVRADLVGALGYPAARTFALETPVDLARFDPDRPLPDGRAALDLAPTDLAFGIVARMQRHRRFGVLLEAVLRAARALPALKLVVIGRGTHQDEVAREPARERGLASRVRFPGYLAGDAYVAALRALDAKIFLVPGSDASCRAVREALAMGLPVVAARRGMLAEIVKDGETGLIVDDTPEGLAAALVRLGEDPALRARLGAAARADARARFSLEANARAHAEAYARALAEPRLEG